MLQEIDKEITLDRVIVNSYDSIYWFIYDSLSDNNEFIKDVDKTLTSMIKSYKNISLCGLLAMTLQTLYKKHGCLSIVMLKDNGGSIDVVCAGDCVVMLERTDGVYCKLTDKSYTTDLYKYTLIDDMSSALVSSLSIFHSLPNTTSRCNKIDLPSDVRYKDVKRLHVMTRNFEKHLGELTAEELSNGLSIRPIYNLLQTSNTPSVGEYNIVNYNLINNFISYKI